MSEPGLPESGRASACRLPASVLLLAAVLARIPGLGRSFFYDELLTARTFVDSFAHAFAGQRQANNHPLASVLAWASSCLLGSSETALRLPSLALGALGVVALFLLVRRRGGIGAASAAALLALAHPGHVGYSQDLRGYGGVLLFTPVVLLLTLEVLDGRAGARLLALAVALGLFAHLTLGVVVLGCLVHVALAAAVPGRARRRAAIALVAGVLLALLLYAPMLSHLASFAQKKTGLTDSSGGGPSLERIEAVIVSLTASDARLLPPGAVASLAIGLGLLAVLGAASSLRSGDRLASAVGTVLLTSIVLWTVARPLFYPRFFAFLLPLLLALAGRGASVLARTCGSTRLAPIAAAPLVVLLAIGSAHRATKETQPTRKALALAATRASPGNVCVLGLGAELLDPARSGEAALEAACTGAPSAAVIELFPERHEIGPALEAAMKRHGLEEKFRITLTGLTSDVVVHVLGPG